MDQIMRSAPSEILQRGAWGTIGAVVEARSEAPHSRYVQPRFGFVHQSELEVWKTAKGWQACDITQVHIVVGSPDICPAVRS